MKSANKNIPPQTQGEQTDFTDSVSADNLAEAHRVFLSAKAKLLDISNWHVYCGPGSAVFGLTDDKGILIHRLAEIGDYFYINLSMAPGSAAGDGYEWVKIEDVIEQGDIDQLEESVTMMIRPVPDPRKKNEEVAHFYANITTNTFIVARYGNKISVEAHGRNETPNNKNVNLHDAIRNTALALSARVGLSGVQWKTLVKGLLEE